jgi:hypothetical protein
MDCESTPSMMPGGGEDWGIMPGGITGGMEPLQSSSIGPSDTTIGADVAGGVEFRGRVIRLHQEQPEEQEEQEELEVLLHPAARHTENKLKAIKRLQDIVIPRFAVGPDRPGRADANDLRCRVNQAKARLSFTNTE